MRFDVAGCCEVAQRQRAVQQSAVSCTPVIGVELLSFAALRANLYDQITKDCREKKS